MVGKSRKLSMARHLFFALLILCLTVVIFLLYLSDSSTSQKENVSDVKYVKISPPVFSEDMLDSNFKACFFSNAEGFTHSNLSTFNRRKIGKHPLINTLLQFAEFSRMLEMETFLLEPSLLFCVLSPTLRSLLLKRNFTTAKRSSEHVLTMGIFQNDVVFLEKEDVQSQLAKNGFQIEIVELPILSWMTPKTYLNSSMFTSHIFLQKDKCILHLVVFHERKNFLWHSALLSQADLRTKTKETLLFVEADSAFENFTAVSLGFKIPRLKNVSIPTNPASFLHQIETSKFIDCNETIVNLFRRQSLPRLSTHHESANPSPLEFNQRLLIALEELKLMLDPLLIRFWVWSGTLLGLHRQCDVIPYTSDVDFASWATDSEDIDKLIKVFKQNKHLTIKLKLGMVKEGLELQFKCHGLSVDLFFIYEQENGTWYAGHRYENGYYFKGADVICIRSGIVNLPYQYLTCIVVAHSVCKYFQVKGTFPCTLYTVP